MKFRNININGQNINETIEVNDHESLFIYGNASGEANLELVLNAPESSFHLYGILVGTGTDKFTINTTSNHLAQNAVSRVHIKTVMFDNAEFNFNGMIKIQKKAQLSDAYLKNDNMILGDDAVVNSTPQLEISADDVKASHGVTIATIDDIEKYYLQSRGLTRTESEKLLVYGFINEIAGIHGVEVDAFNLLPNLG